MITFNEIPSDLLTPGGYIEFDPSRAGTGNDQATVLLIGQQTIEGEADADTIYDIGSENDAIRLFGAGSMLHTMTALFLKYNFSARLKAADVKVAGTEASWMVHAADATEAGIVALEISGADVSVAVAANEEAASIVSKLVDAVNSYSLPVAASVSEADDTDLVLTARHAGELANDIQVAVAEDALPYILIGDTTSGAGRPDLATLIDNMADDSYDYIVNPYLDADNLSKLKTECDRRWHAMVAMESHVFMTERHDYTQALAFAATQNSSHFTFMPIQDTPQPAYIWTTVLAAIATGLLKNDPAAPLGDQPLPELIPGKTFSKRDQNTLLHNGCSTFNVVVDTVYISYLVTMYQLNAQGKKDSAYRDIQVPEILKNIRRTQIYEAMKTYSGYKVARDASKYAAGQKIIDADEVKGFLYDLYRERFMREYGWVQDDMKYLDELIVEISVDNNDHVFFQDRPNLIGQFRVLAGRTQFIDK